MSDETHDVRAGAARSAPTAPHATEPAPQAKGAKPRKPTGPEKFWSARRAAMALVVCAALSIGLHYAALPFSLLPTAKIELHDSADELAIPIDLVAMPAPEPPPPPTTAPTAAPASETPKGEGPGHASDAGVKHRDAGARDAMASDGGESDAAIDGGASDAAITDASGDGASDAGLFASGERDGGGALEGVASGPAFVKVAIDMTVIRTNPIGAQLGPLFKGIPQWDEFMGGTDVDPVRDVDWIYIFGPGLIHTEKDAVLVHYGMTDARAALNIALMSKKDASGGAWDAGVPGVKAWRGHADRAWRVFMLPQPGLAVMVPPEFAPKAARAFSRAAPSVPFRQGEAVRFTIANATHALQGQVPEGLGELRLWVVPRGDGGADAWAEIDAPDSATADATARRVKQIARETNSLAVKIVTRGLLDGVDVSSDGAMMRAHLSASQEQLAALYDVVSAFLGVNSAPAATGAPPSAPLSSPPIAPSPGHPPLSPTARPRPAPR